MTAIETRYIGPTNHRGARIKVIALGTKQTLTVGWNHAHDVRENHQHAAMALASRMGWSGKWHGGDSERGMVFVWEGQHLLQWEGFVVAEKLTEVA